MNTILILTLGTSPGPIVNCISSLRPDRVVFLCSSQTQNQVQTVRAQVPLADFDEARDVVVLQQRLSSKQGEEVCNELDQLDRVYLRSLNLFQQLREQSPGCQLIADYTGGTKTMTTGLAMAAIDDGNVKLHLTSNDRIERKNAPSSYSVPVAVSTAAIHARRLQERELPALLKRHDYEAARQAVRRVQAYAESDHETARQLRRLEALLVAFDAWDRFDHRRALEVLTQLGDPSLREWLEFPLKRVIASRRVLDPHPDDHGMWMNGHGLEAVEDLMRNAERRATQERFDDAVGRLYRAMELTAQLLLKTDVTDKVGREGIETGAVAIDRLPQDIQPKWREVAARKSNGSPDAPLELGLKDAYDLLADLGHPTGERWTKQRDQLIHALRIRNHSLFAHGFAPVDYGRWNELLGTFGDFMREAVDASISASTAVPAVRSTLAQLPSTLAELLDEACST